LHAQASILLDAQDLAKAAAHRAEALGWTAVIDNTCDEWEYQAAAKYLLERLQSLHSHHSRVCLISVGEVIVGLPTRTKTPGSVGIGGRNQQFAVYVATQLMPSDGAVGILSAGSDGIDGNSTAAGAVVDENTAREPRDRSSALLALESFNTYPFLQTRNATITTGPSGNNLRDLRILLG
jgi:hydroxypyruvate reductase